MTGRSSVTAKRGRYSDVATAAFENANATLFDIRQRFDFVDAIQKALLEVTAGKSFRLYNAPLWNMMVGELGKTYVDLGSWTKALYSKGGVIRILNAEHTTLSRPLKKAEKIDPPIWVGDPDPRSAHSLQKSANAGLQAARDASFGRLFPCAIAASRETPNGHDFDALIARLDRELEPLQETRHYHAHRYERTEANASNLTLETARPLLDDCTSLLADLDMLASNAGHQAPMNAHHTNDPKVTDIVDLLLFGQFIGMTGPMYKNAPPTQTTHTAKRLAHYKRVLDGHHEANGALDFLNPPR